MIHGDLRWSWAFVEEAYAISETSVAEALGGIPEYKMRCSNLAPAAIRNAIDDWKLRLGETALPSSNPRAHDTIFLTTVSRTFVLPTVFAGALNKSCESTITSASFPASREPTFFSMNSAYAPFRVYPASNSSSVSR